MVRWIIIRLYLFFEDISKCLFLRKAPWEKERHTTFMYIASVRHNLILEMH